MDSPFRIGDTVLHAPSGETWIVAAVDGEDLFPAGWPESLARTSDCSLVRAATDEQHARFVREVRKSSGLRAARARAHGCSVCATSETTP